MQMRISLHIYRFKRVARELSVEFQAYRMQKGALNLYYENKKRRKGRISQNFKQNRIW